MDTSYTYEMPPGFVKTLYPRKDCIYMVYVYDNERAHKEYMYTKLNEALEMKRK